MPSFLTLHEVAMATPVGRPLFSGLSLSIGRERVGVVGRNGSGKSSLLRAILGEQAPQSGTIALGGTVGVLRQSVEAGPGTIAEALGIADALARLDRIEAGAALAADLDHADWDHRQRLDEAMSAVGLRGIDVKRPLASLSGGERTRIAIARLLLDPPDLLLLDEPTNNLDRDGGSAVAELLANWRGGALVVSHDRALLEDMDRIVALSPASVSIHGGGWSSWVAERDAARSRVQVELEGAKRQIRDVRRATQEGRERQARRDRVGRTYAASGSAPKILMGRQRERAEKSAGRGSSLGDQRIEVAAASLESARTQVEIVTPMRVVLPSSALSSDRLVLSFDDVCWNVGERTILDHLSFEVRGPERVALIGRNGAGKTTVFRLAAGLVAPATGMIQRPVPFAMLDQSVSLLDRHTTLAANMRRLDPTLGENQARAALARFAFRNIEADKLVSELSGGECLRAGLACVLSAHPVPQLLMLDEPTNHLDLDSIEVIEAALRGFDGALVVISHDAAFLEAIQISRRIPL